MKGICPLIGLMVCVFLFNASEFLPVSLLTDIARDLGTTDFQAGLLISFYAWAVALLSLPIMLLLRKMEYKRMFLICILVFMIFQALSGLSDSYWMLLVSRIGVAVSHSVFWSIVTPIAVRIVDPEHKEFAIGSIATGTCIALVAGLPLGRMIGIAMGWRWSFLTIAIISLVMLVVMYILLPRLENPGTFTLKGLPGIFRNRTLVGIYVVLVLVVTGIFTGYSYIEPFLENFASFSESDVTLLLTVFGLAGVVGSFAFSRLFKLHRKAFIVLTFAGIALTMLLLNPSSGTFAAVAVVIFLWGFCYITFSTSLQSILIDESPSDAVPIAMSIYSGLYNAGIATGSLIGGSVMTNFGVQNIGFVGAAFAAVSTLLLLIMLLPRIGRGEASAD